MPKKEKTSWVVWLRRLTQAACFVFFIYLFFQTSFHPNNKVGKYVTLFFNLDPLIAFDSWLASHTVVRAMLLSLITVVVTVLTGRWFCGWICPFGTLHHFFASRRRGSAKQKIEAGSYNSWQKAKYYILVGFLMAAVLKVNVVGWLDPFSFFFRSLTTAVYPAINAGTVGLFTWIYNVNPGIGPVRLTLVTEPVYDVLRRNFLALHQPYFVGSLLIGLLFIVIVALNFYRPRFWCRYICPLGALLGVLGKNPLVRLKKNEEQCNNCRLCLIDCQGGEALDKVQAWRPSECFYCWNCESECPSQAITFGWVNGPGGKHD
jgi:polyferredoxin